MSNSAGEELTGPPGCLPYQFVERVLLMRRCKVCRALHVSLSIETLAARASEHDSCTAEDRESTCSPTQHAESHVQNTQADVPGAGVQT